MKRKRKILISSELKRQILAQTFEKDNSFLASEDLGVDIALPFLWDKEQIGCEFDHIQDNNILSITDLEQENISLQKLLSGAKLEHDQLKKAISILSVNDRKFTWS